MADSQRSGGIGFIGALQIAFIVLKLCDIISWPWWVVLMPAIVYTALFVILVIIVFIGAITKSY